MDQLLWLPQKTYSDEDVSLKSRAVYQHIYSTPQIEIAVST